MNTSLVEYLVLQYKNLSEPFAPNDVESCIEELVKMDISNYNTVDTLTKYIICKTVDIDDLEGWYMHLGRHIAAWRLQWIQEQHNPPKQCENCWKNHPFKYRESDEFQNEVFGRHDNGGLGYRGDEVVGHRDNDRFGFRDNNGLEPHDDKVFGPRDNNGLGLRDNDGFGFRGDEGFRFRGDEGFRFRGDEGFGRLDDDELGYRDVSKSWKESHFMSNQTGPT